MAKLSTFQRTAGKSAAPGTPSKSPLATGLPLEEIASLIGHWDAKEKIIDWSKTNTGWSPAYDLNPVPAKGDEH